MLYLEKGDHMLSQEGVTQGDNAAVAMYALSTWLLIQALGNETANDEVKQVWYADDSSTVRSHERYLSTDLHFVILAITKCGSREKWLFVRHVFVKKFERATQFHGFFKNISTLYPC